MEAPKEVTRGERQVSLKAFREWGGCFTRASRTGMPENKWFHLENLQPIGDANVHSVPNISASLLNYGADSIYWSQYANIGGTDYLINFASNGKVFAYNLGAGTSAQINAGPTLLSGSNSKMDQWKNQVIVIIDANGLFAWDGATFVKIVVAGVPTSGQAIAVFAGRVWIAQGRVLFFSVADGYGGAAGDWTAANGAGFVNLTDPQLRSNVTQMVSANGYLYIFGTSSINVISDVYVPTGAAPPVPVFTNLNVQAIIGTDQPASVFPFNRSLMFANKYGAFALNGVNAEKLSDDIDGTWQYLDTSRLISGGQVVISNILTGAFLFNRLNDPTFGTQTVIAMWFDGKWWFANFGSITFVVSAVQSGQTNLFCFIGNQLYKLFSDVNSAPNTRFMTPLWAMDDPIRDKEVLKAGIELQVSQLTGSLTANVDSPNSSVPFQTGTVVGAVQWINNSGSIVQWQNNALAIVQWFNGTYILYAGAAPGTFAKYVGMSGTTTGIAYQLSSVFMDYAFGKRW